MIWPITAQQNYCASATAATPSRLPALQQRVPPPVAPWCRPASAARRALTWPRASPRRRYAWCATSTPRCSYKFSVPARHPGSPAAARVSGEGKHHWLRVASPAPGAAVTRSALSCAMQAAANGAAGVGLMKLLLDAGAARGCLLPWGAPAFVRVVRAPPVPCCGAGATPKAMQWRAVVHDGQEDQELLFARWPRGSASQPGRLRDELISSRTRSAWSETSMA